MQQKQDIFLKVTCIFWIITKLISVKAWLGSRTYPIIPAFEFLDSIPFVIHDMLFYLSIATCAFLFMRPKNWFFLAILLLIEIASCLLDVIRWQPLVYQTIFTFLIFLLNRNDSIRLDSCLKFLFASLYIFSGLHKLNGGFLYSIWDQMILENFLGLSHSLIAKAKLHYIGLFIPVLEIVGGISILVIKRKTWPAILLISTHLFILLWIGPLGLNYNIFVWPWNIAMIIFLYILYFIDKAEFSFHYLMHKKNKIILLFWGILPMLSFIGYWDNYLSSSLYSGDTKSLSICIKEKSQVNDTLAQYISMNDKYKTCNGMGRLSLQKWSIHELGIVPYPEEWYYKRLKKKWIKLFPDIDAEFVIYSYPYIELQKI